MMLVQKSDSTTISGMISMRELYNSCRKEPLFYSGEPMVLLAFSMFGWLLSLAMGFADLALVSTLAIVCCLLWPSILAWWMKAKRPRLEPGDLVSISDKLVARAKHTKLNPWVAGLEPYVGQTFALVGKHQTRRGRMWTLNTDVGYLIVPEAVLELKFANPW